MLGHSRLFVLVCGLYLLGGSLLSAQDFTILFTGSANGVFQNCHCPDAPLGGLDKRAQFIDAYRERDPQVLLIDNGDNFVDYLTPGIEDLFITSFGIMNYDMINLGDQDIAYGPAAYFGLPALIRVHGTAVTIRKGGVTISILPILHPAATRFYPPFVFEDISTAAYREQIEAWLGSTAPETTVRVLLSHAGYDIDRDLAQTYPAIDLIIGGHSQTVLDTLVRVAGVPIVQAGGNGGYVGALRLTLRAGDLVVRDYQLHPLTLELPGHPDIIKHIDQYLGGN